MHTSAVGRAPARASASQQGHVGALAATPGDAAATGPAWRGADGSSPQASTMETRAANVASAFIRLLGTWVRATRRSYRAPCRLSIEPFSTRGQALPQIPDGVGHLSNAEQAAHCDV